LASQIKGRAWFEGGREEGAGESIELKTKEVSGGCRQLRNEKLQ